MPIHESDEPQPDGFMLHTRCESWENRDRQAFELYIPTQLKSALDIEKKRATDQRIAEKKARDLQEEEALYAQSRLAAQSSDPGTSAPGLVRPPVADQDYDPRVMHPVYSSATAAQLAARAALSCPDKELRKRDEELGKKLLEAGPLRSIAMPEGALAALDALRQGLPHFKEVIDLVRGQLLLASRSRRSARIPPILLNGEPGLGKTHFAVELAKALGTAVRRISFDSAISAATLMGSERRWGNTAYGSLFELVCLGEHANPVVVLDEIDKASLRNDWNPLAPLHTLLEASTAAHARDISVDFEFDASQVTWIATANHAMRLPASLRSRFTQFQIERPDAQGAITSARAVVQKAFDDMALEDFELPPRLLSVGLAHLTAREIRQATEQACASAVARGRQQVTWEDVPARFRDESAHAGARAGGKPPGWLH
ncbi:MAG: AAA family ATPase [Burkholderiales bacterium]|nr:AAA family ATPase [Burkholderiales bacterium]